MYSLVAVIPTPKLSTYVAWLPSSSLTYNTVVYLGTAYASIIIKKNGEKIA